MAEESQDKPPVDFPALAEEYEGEESALMLVDYFEQKLTNEHELEKLLDAVIYEDYPQVKALAHTLKGSALQINAMRMSKLAEALQNAGINHDRDIAKEKLGEFIKETQKVHAYLFELLKKSKEEADETLSKTYEVLRIYTRENPATDHFNLAELVESYGDEDSAVMMLEMGLTGGIKEEKFFEKFYKCLMQPDLKTLDHTAHQMKGRSNYVSATKLVESTNKLKTAAREGKEAECYPNLIDVLDESLFMERFININKFLKDEPTEKYINLQPELVKLLENRNNIPEIMKELKDSYVPEAPAKAERNDANANQEVQSPNVESGSGAQPEIVGGEEITVKPPHFHENSIRTILESIPEEKEKEEVKQNSEEKLKTIESSLDENNYGTGGNADAALENNRPQGSSYSESNTEENKRDEAQSNKQPRPVVTHIHQNLEEIKERQEESMDSPTGLGKNSSRNTENKEELSPPKSIDRKTRDESSVEKAPTVVFVQTKTKKTREFQASDDDYPFDSGLKCNIF